MRTCSRSARRRVCSPPPGAQPACAGREMTGCHRCEALRARHPCCFEGGAGAVAGPPDGSETGSETTDRRPLLTALAFMQAVHLVIGVL
jgi:hypothetical protein